MRRVLVAVASAFLVAAPAADAASHGTCSKPQHLHKGFKDGRVVLLWDLGSQFNSRWYLCRPGVRRPQLWYDTGGPSDQTIGPIFNRAGSRIAFGWTVDNGAEGEYQIGWVDIRTRKTRIVHVDEDAWAVAPRRDGALAYLESNRTIRYVPPRGKPRFLIDVPTGSVVPRSLRLSKTGVSWKTRKGEKKLVPLNYTPRSWEFIREYAIPTPSSKPVSITAGPDGALWFTEYGAAKIGRITTDGHISEFRTRTAKSRPDQIVAGPDGALWFTEGAANKIGRITTDGQVTEYAVPTPKSAPGGIAAGPDGALWFVERAGKKVGRITTDGQLSEFPVAGKDFSLGAITAGPDQALWFSFEVTSVNSMVRMTTDGQITGRFELKFLVATVATATTGPDGALWLAEIDHDHLGRMTTGGAFTEFPARTRPSGVTGITTGPDGALWFTEQSADQIGRSTVDGKMTEFRLHTGSQAPFAIAAGPDGAIWFTEYDSNKIGRITTDAVP